MIINSGNNRARHRNNAISDINITPFVDVLLVLLIIFMVTAPIITGGLNVDLPDGVSKQDQVKEAPITISLKENGAVYLGEDKIDINSISYQLHKKTNKNFKSQIHVKADKKNDYGRVMQIVKKINQAGFFHIVLVTEAKL